MAVLIAYLYLALRQENASARAGHGSVYDKRLALQEIDARLAPPSEPVKSLLVATLIAVAGLVLVVIGGRFLVEGAVSSARGFGISESVICLTIVAVGASMPEFEPSVAAYLRK